MNLLKLSHLHKGAFYVFLSAAGFSVKAILAKLAYEAGADVITILFLRVLFAAPLFMLLAYWNAQHQKDAKNLSRNEILSLLGLGLLGLALLGLGVLGLGLLELELGLVGVVLFGFGVLSGFTSLLEFGVLPDRLSR